MLIISGQAQLKGILNIQELIYHLHKLGVKRIQKQQNTLIGMVLERKEVTPK